MIELSIQYLGDGAASAAIEAKEARARLRHACELLDLDSIIIGWNLPRPLVEACREEAARAKARLYLWHPLFCSDGSFQLDPSWQTVSPGGKAVAAFEGIAEFGFACTNNPHAAAALLEHLEKALARGDYDGVFLDRMRLPSPMPGLAGNLACFCEHCQEAAREKGLDLAAARDEVQRLLASVDGTRLLTRALFLPAAESELLASFFSFRRASVSDFVSKAVALARQRELSVGLDCFSPALANSVGQDIAALAPHADWVKIMCYGHTLGPAGIPFELLDLANFLVDKQGLEEADALPLLAAASGLPLPTTRRELADEGLAAEAMTVEVGRARRDVTNTLYAGLELVRNEAVKTNEEKLVADIKAMKAAGADGLSLSWDLWHMPDEWLDLVARNI